MMVEKCLCKCHSFYHVNALKKTIEIIYSQQTAGHCGEVRVQASGAISHQPALQDGVQAESRHEAAAGNVITPLLPPRPA